jgi:hypothetical protein
LETVERDYSDKGVSFYYVYKPLAHPEYNNYIAPITIEERLMHVAEAKRLLGTSVNWLADTMANVFHEAMGQTPNSELVIDPDGVIVAARAWSDPEELRRDMERLIGPVDHPTTIADLDLPTQPPAPTVAKGIVPRIEKPQGMLPIEIAAVLDSSDIPFYAKIRAEGDSGILANGSGTMYLGFHLDPLYHVHWNNEAGPVTYQLNAPPGVTVSPASGTGPDVSAPADSDPREFLVNVTAESIDQPLELDVFYFGCDDALTFCIPVTQSYEITLTRDESHDWSIQSDENGPILGGGPGGVPGGGRGGAGRGRGAPDMSSLDTDGDGRISLDEAPEQMKGFFGQIDSNGDGYVSADEMQGGARRR